MRRTVPEHGGRRECSRRAAGRSPAPGHLAGRGPRQASAEEREAGREDQTGIAPAPTVRSGACRRLRVRRTLRGVDPEGSGPHSGSGGVVRRWAASTAGSPDGEMAVAAAGSCGLATSGTRGQRVLARWWTRACGAGILRIRSTAEGIGEFFRGDVAAVASYGWRVHPIGGNRDSCADR